MKLEGIKTGLYEILVPSFSNEGKNFSVLAWNKLESFLINKSGGYTKLPPVEGVWVDENKVYGDTNIPYRVVLSEEDFENVLEYVKIAFNQKEVMGYKISDEVLIFS